MFPIPHQSKVVVRDGNHTCSSDTLTIGKKLIWYSSQKTLFHKSMPSAAGEERTGQISPFAISGKYLQIMDITISCICIKHTK